MRGSFFLCGLLACLAQTAFAQVDLGGAEAVEEIVTANRDGYTIAGLVTRTPGKTAFKYGVLQFPGHPSIMRLHEEDGRLVYDLKGNTLVRGRKLWLDGDTLVVTADAPTDQWGTFDLYFRRQERYGRDIAALLKVVTSKYPVQEWTFIGHSEGTVSAYGAAVPNPQLARRVVLVSSVLSVTRNGPGLTGLDWESLAGKLLWVHHENDPCQYTAYRSARQYAERSNSPLLTVRGGESQGDACRAMSFHGLTGMEEKTFAAIRTWIRTGAAPTVVEPQQ